MALGNITSLGLGSGLELNSILDQLKEVDQAPITSKKKEQEKVEKQIAAYDVVKAKILSMKSFALSLSLESSFIERSTTTSKEEIVSATAMQGAEIGKHTIEVTQLAQKSSFQSAGFESETSVAYGPLIEEILTGQADTTADVAISEDQPLQITYDTEDGLRQFSVDLTAGMTLDDVVDAINNGLDNQADGGGNHVSAQTFQDSDGSYGIKLTYPAPEKTFSYKLGTDGATIDVSMVSGTTLSQLAALINNDDDNPGVTARIIDTGIGSDRYQLVLQANESGESNRISILSPLGTIPLTEANGADGASLNAQLTANGISYQRQSNSGITDIIQGVTLGLNGEGTSTVDVTADTKSIKTNIQGLVDSFNDLIKEIRVNTEKDEETEEEGLFSSAYSIKSVINEISTLFASVIKTEGPVTTIMDIGVDIDLRSDLEEDEKGDKLFKGVTLNEETLDQALSQNFDSFMKLFLGDSEKEVGGLADTINNALRDMSSDSGAVNSVRSSAQNRIDTLENSIKAETERLEKRYDLMSLEFVKLDTYISRMNSQGEYLKSMIDSFSASTQS